LSDPSEPRSARYLLDEYRRKGFARELGFGERPAVLAVDMIRAFTDPASPLGSDYAREIAATRELLDAARRRGRPVLFTTTAYDDDYGDGGLFVRKVPALEALLRGSPAVELDPRLGRGPAEPLIEKQYASAFFGTGLEKTLRDLAVDTLLVAGFTTSGCIRATVVDALQNGFRAMVVLDCVGDRAEGPHRANLLDVQGKYGDVVALDAAVAYLEAGAAEARP